jgi:glycosyltransferase involved in cell wall biosynthesis
MRILWVVSYYKPAYLYGGPVQSNSALCEALARQGAEVTVLTTNANGPHRLAVPLNKPVSVEGVQVFYYPLVRLAPKSFFYSPELVRAIERMAEEFQIAILDTLFTHAMGPAANICIRRRVPYVIPLHGQLLPTALKHRHIKKRLYLALAGGVYLNRAAALHCTTWTEAQAAAKLGLDTHSFVVPNALDVKTLARPLQAAHFKTKLGIRADDRVVLFLGRLHRVKRPEIALQAFAAMGLPDVHLVYAGADEEHLESKLRSLARALRCADRVHFAGLLDSTGVRQVLAETDLLMMPSEMESFGMSAAEAMAAGVPVLLSHGVALGHWVEEAQAGRVVSGTADAFAQAGRALLSEPALLRAMGERGRELVQRRFAPANIAKQFLTECESIVGRVQDPKST